MIAENRRKILESPAKKEKTTPKKKDVPKKKAPVGPGAAKKAATATKAKGAAATKKKGVAARPTATKPKGKKSVVNEIDSLTLKTAIKIAKAAGYSKVARQDKMNEKRGLVAPVQNKNQKAQQSKQNREKVAQQVKQKFGAPRRNNNGGGGGAGKLKISFNPQNLKKTTDKTVSAQIAGAMARSGGFGGKNNNYNNKSPKKQVSKPKIVKH